MEALDSGPAWTTGLMNPFFAPSPDGYFQFWKAAMTFPAQAAIETLRFGSQRLKAQADHWEKILQCETADQWLEVQSSFMTDTAKEYEREGEHFAASVRTATGTPALAA